MQFEYLFQLVSYANNILNSLSSNQAMESVEGNQQTAKIHKAELTLCIMKVACAPSKDSDQLWHPSLIRIHCLPDDSVDPKLPYIPHSED